MLEIAIFPSTLTCLRNKLLTLASVLFTKSVAGRQLWGHTETVSSGHDGQLSLQVFVV